MYAQERARQIVDELISKGEVVVDRHQLIMHRDLASALEREVESRRKELRGLTITPNFIDDLYTYRLEGHEHKPAQNG